MLKTDFDKLAEAEPPQDVEAERGTIASMMLCRDDPARFERIRKIVWPAAFFQPDHRVLFDAMCAVVDSGRPVDVLLLHAELKKRGVWDEIGGAAHVAEILDSHFTAIHGEHYAEIVADRAREREVIDAAMKLAAQMVARNGTAASRRAVRSAIDTLSRVASHGAGVEIFKLEDILIEFLEHKDAGKAVHLLSGVALLDQFRGLFSLGKYTVVAGRPSMGKSTFIRWLLNQFAARNVTCGLISVEEDREKIAGNYISAESGMENEAVANDDWNTGEWMKATEAVARLSPLPIHGTDSAFTLDAVVAAFDMLALQHGCQIIAVDHLHLIEHGADTRERELTQISGAIKRAAKQRGVCAIAGAQLSRPERGKVPPPPQMSDLRASGSIEEHADAVLLMHRPDYYRRFEHGYTPNGLCQFLIPKNRNGRVGEVILTAELQYQRFTDPPAEIPEGLFQ